MSHSSFEPAAVEGPGIAAPHDSRRRPIDPSRPVGGAAGGLYGSVADFTLLLAVYARRGRPVLGEAAFSAMTTAVAPVDMKGVTGASHGLDHGVHRTKSGGTVVFRSGGNFGYLAYFVVALDTGSGMVVVSNSGEAVPVLSAVVAAWGEVAEVDLPPLY